MTDPREPDPATRDDPDQPPHDPTGLDLAREIARSARRRPDEPVRRRRPRRGLGPQSSGAHPDDRDPQLLGEAVSRLFERQGWSREVNVHVMMGRWAELVGAAIADHSAPQGYADGVLTIRTDSTAWATELRLQAPRIVAVLNRALGQGTVTQIVVKGPDAPSWRHGPRTVPGRGPRDTYG